jgi:polysaccharide biosynthesis/export protein
MKLKFLFICLISLVLAGVALGQQPDQLAPVAVPSVTPVDAGAAAPPVDLRPFKNYMLGPGDQVIVTVSGEKDYDFIGTIDEDGRIPVPFSDTPVVAGCMTEAGFRAKLATLLEKYLRNPQVAIRTEKRSRPQATVYGEVNRPIGFDMNRKASLVELLAFAGGVKEEASGIIQVSRTMPPPCGAPDDPDNWRADSTDPTVVPSRIFRVEDLKVGTEGSNPTIYPGDVIYVHKAAPVYLTGDVVSPQGIYLKDGLLSVTQAIAKVGGLKPSAKRNNILINRLKPGTNDQFDVISANYDLIMKGQQKDVLLKPYDIVVVDVAKPGIAKQILSMALGAARTGVYTMTQSIGVRVIY